MERKKSRSKGRVAEVFLLAAYFIFLTLVFTRPLVTKITTHTMGGYGDNHYFLWIIGWVKQAIFDLQQSPHKSFLLNHPHGYQLALTEIAPLQILVALPFALKGDNPTLGFNIAMLSTFVLSGLTMYFWVKHLTKSRVSSLVAATAYAFLPYHFAHMLSGHLNLVSIQWFPLYFWGFIGILHGKVFSWKHVFLLTIGLSGIALSSQYYLYMTLFITMVIFLIDLVRARFQIGWLRWKQFIIAGAVSLPALVVGIVPYYLVHRGANTARPFADVMIFSASFSDYLLPFTKSSIAGEWVSRYFARDQWGEATLYLGLPVMLLAVAAIIKNRPIKREKIIRTMVGIGAIAFLLSLGTNLSWMEAPVVMQTPAWLRTIFKQDAFYVYLPGYVLYKYFPYYNIMRAWMRYGIFVMVMVCALAGIGAAALEKRFKTPQRYLFQILLLASVILDFHITPISLVAVEPRPVDIWLANQPQGGQVQIPLAQSFEQRSIYSTLINQKPLIGQMNTYPSHRYFQLEPILRHFPDVASVETLKEEQIRYVLVDNTLMEIDRDQLHDLPIHYAGTYGDFAVYELQK